MSENFFVEFTAENQVDVGSAVILRCETAARLAFCPFNTLLVERIERGKTPEGNIYHLVRPYMIRTAAGFVVEKETLSVQGFTRFAESFVGHNHGKGRLYVVAR